MVGKYNSQAVPSNEYSRVGQTIMEARRPNQYIPNMRVLNLHSLRRRRRAWNIVLA